MYYSQALLALQNLTNKVNISQAEIGRIIGVTRSAMNGRVQRNSSFTDEEIDKINDFYKVDVRKYMDKHANNVNTINILPICASCGNGITIDTSLIYNYDEKAQYIFAVCSGASMEPILLDKDIVLAKKYDGNFTDGIYLFNIGDDFFIKTLAKNVNQIECISANPQYDKIVLKGQELDKLVILGSVCGIIRKF